MQLMKDRQIQIFFLTFFSSFLSDLLMKNLPLFKHY